MMKKLLFLLSALLVFNVQSQIVIDNNAPNDDPIWLVNNVLLGGGVTASNHSYQGDSAQIGWFDAVNTNLGIDAGIVLCTGDVHALDPINGGGFPFIANTVTDPDLLAVANSVPSMIGQTFTVSSINDVAVLEFDFIASSNLLEFKYAFGSQEYFFYENTQYNDVFGFFLSGPGITGPWSSPAIFPNGSINLAVVPNVNPPLPITISSVCNEPLGIGFTGLPAVMNPQYFVSNQGTGLDTIASAVGFTTVLTATSVVQCGETYHIKLAIADGSDQGLSSYVWLEAGSFSSPIISVVDDLGIDSTVMLIGCDANITLTVNAGDSATYEWFDSNSVVFSTDTSVSVGAGSYIVAATIAGCTFYSDSLIILSAAADSLPPTSLKCVAESNGVFYFDWEHPLGASAVTSYKIMASTNVGGPYSNISNVNYPAATYSHIASSLPQGTQFFYVTTTSACIETLTSDTISPISFSVSSTDVNCWDDTDGYIAIDVQSVQLTPYSFYIDNILNTNAYPLDTSFFDLGTGTYDIKVSDNAFCEIIIPVTITAPGFPLQALVANSTNTCYGSALGFAVGSGAGGTPGYTYSWYESGNPVSFIDNDTAFGLSAGSYYLEVIDSNGCDTFATVNVIAPQTPLIGSPQLFNVECKGDDTGMIVADAAGSWSPYQYHWLGLNGDTLDSRFSGVNTTTRDTLFGLLSGTYQLHLYDGQGCFVDYYLNITEPAVKLSIDSMVVIDAISCYGDSVGRARLYSGGGQLNYSYLWDNGEVGIIADELTSGYHSVILSDDWGCEVLDSIYVPENVLIESELTTVQGVSCYGLSNGIASISSFGGSSSAYTYFWSQGQQTPGVNTDVATGLLHGSYYVTTRDALGCEVVDSIYISEPEPLSMEAFELDWIDCYGANDGLAGATAVGGTLPYIFNWDNGQWIGDTVNTLTPGLHTVLVTDAKGCMASDTVFTHEPTALYINIDESQAVLPYCGQLNVNTASLPSLAGGGTGSYAYVWNDNLAQPQTTTTAFALTPYNYYNGIDSSYIVTVTDEKGCIARDTTMVLQDFNETMGVVLTSLVQYIGGNDVSCYGEDDGMALVVAFGAHAPYTYDWYGPSSYSSVNDTIFNLVAGIYSVTVKDTNDCQLNASIPITEPDYIYFTSLGAVDEICLGACNGEIQLDVSGGVLPYTGIATESATGDVITSLISLNMMLGVCSGDYTIELTDANDCPSSLINGGVVQQTIGTSEFTSATIDPNTIVNVLCNGSNTGELEVLTPNMNTGYSYSWQNVNNSGVTISNTPQASNLIAGVYVLYAEYLNYEGCTTTDTVTLTELPLINPIAVITNVDCYGNATGILQGSVQGGVGPYNLQWNPGGITGSAISNLTAGTYTLTATDSYNCQEVDTFEVTEPQVLTANITQNGYVLTATTVLGGVMPFSYSWREQLLPNNEIGTGSTYVVANYGTYSVIVTDVNGCVVASNSILFSESWDCIDGACLDPGDGNGLYSILSACELSCLGTGVVNASLEEISLSIYPNPFREETTVDFGRAIKQASIKVVDVFGKQLEQYSIANTDKYTLKKQQSKWNLLYRN
tara:strand:- start:144 stop:4841 length:4698 start_codon:yes stop_codon:yes gene_type:complete